MNLQFIKTGFLTLVATGLAISLLGGCSRGPADGDYTFKIFTTNDVHGRYFDSLYVEKATKPSLMGVYSYIDSVRVADGRENVILIDAGDCLQGDNAAYYYNYVDTVSKHLYARMVEYMGYDAVAVGNHDIETGHPVYDRLASQMKVPFLAANAIRNDNGYSYFKEYVILNRHGLKIAIIGFTNPNIKSWLSEDLWSGMTFTSLLPKVQETVDKVKLNENPDAVIVAVHSGTGHGDNSSLESQGLDLLNTLRGVDFVLCAHDHRPVVIDRDSICLINSGSHCRNIGEGTLAISVRDGKVVSKDLSVGLIPVDKNWTSEKMRQEFRQDYEAVKAFTLKPVGELKIDLKTSESYSGMCDYMNLLHTISLTAAKADVSFAAPLTFNGSVQKGTLVFNDLFTIYPFENQLFAVNMTGKEIKDYLEYSYNDWINTIKSANDHILKIAHVAAPRTGQDKWSFLGRSYNFDSAGGLTYTVDVTKPYGSRVVITSLADGRAFNPTTTYRVAMTSYRASGGGDLLLNGAGLSAEEAQNRVADKYPEIRNLIYDYLQTNGVIDTQSIGNPSLIGQWQFIPERMASRAMKKDMALLFE